MIGSNVTWTYLNVPFYCKIVCCLYFLECTLRIVSSRVSAPPKKIDLIPFYLAPRPNNSKSVRPSPPFMRKTSPNFGELDSPIPNPWNVPSSKKAKAHFLKKQKTSFPTMKFYHIWTLKYKYTVAKSKNQRRVRLLLSILFLLNS